MVSPKYLLDTNILSEPTRKNPNQNVLDKLAEFEQIIAIPSIAIYELFKGFPLMPEGRRRLAIGNYLNKHVRALPVFDFDSKAALNLALISSKAQKAGRILPTIDSQIAAIAISNGLTLVTRNLKDFKGYTDLKLENWFS